MKKAELQLTKESIANEGIDIKLSQADVIDMLVDEQVSSIKEIFETLRETSLQLEKEAMREYDEFLEDLAAKQTLPKGLTVIGKNASYEPGKIVTLYTLNEYVDGRSNTTYAMRTKSIAESCSGKLILQYRGTFSGIKMTGVSEPILFKFKHSKKLISLIEQTKEKAEEFIKLVPVKGINEKELARKIKNQFTKEILKTSSPDFRKKLKEGFSIDL